MAIWVWMDEMLFRRHAERLGFTDAQIRDGWAKLTSDPNIEKARIRLHFELGSPGSKPSGMRWQARPAVMRLLEVSAEMRAVTLQNDTTSGL